MDRRIVNLAVPTLEAVSAEGYVLAGSHFALLLLCDARGAETSAIVAMAHRLLKAGLAYFHVWGPDCERVHDIVDEVVVARELSENRSYPVMTTWYSDLPLGDALWALLHLSTPHDVYAPT